MGKLIFVRESINPLINKGVINNILIIRLGGCLFCNSGNCFNKFGKAHLKDAILEEFINLGHHAQIKCLVNVLFSNIQVEHFAFMANFNKLFETHKVALSWLALLHRKFVVD